MADDNFPTWAELIAPLAGTIDRAIIVSDGLIVLTDRPQTKFAYPGGFVGHDLVNIHDQNEDRCQ